VESGTIFFLVGMLVGVLVGVAVVLGGILIWVSRRDSEDDEGGDDVEEQPSVVSTAMPERRYLEHTRDERRPRYRPSSTFPKNDDDLSPAGAATVAALGLDATTRTDAPRSINHEHTLPPSTVSPCPPPSETPSGSSFSASDCSPSDSGSSFSSSGC
jgi:hypothetical protein